MATSWQTGILVKAEVITVAIAMPAGRTVSESPLQAHEYGMSLRVCKNSRIIPNLSVSAATKTDCGFGRFLPSHSATRQFYFSCSVESTTSNREYLRQRLSKQDRSPIQFRQS